MSNSEPLNNAPVTPLPRNPGEVLPFRPNSELRSKNGLTGGNENLPPEARRIVEKQGIRIRQLKQEIVSRHQENEKIIVENFKQNEELRQLNQNLDEKVKIRTRELQKTTERLEQQNLELQELSESKEALMHMIVHDLKNPLTSVILALGLSQKQCFELDDNLRSLLRDARTQANKLHAMIDEILTISRMRSKEYTIQTVPTDLVSLIRQSVVLMNTTKGPKEVTLRFEHRAPEVVVDIDYPLVERVLNNLINNALKYAPRESEILVGLDVTEPWVGVSVTNQGEAIPKAAHTKIFELFGRAQPRDKSVRGTGLGLAFSKQAVKAHGGGIYVESPLPDQDHGVRFVFALPLYIESGQTPG